MQSGVIYKKIVVKIGSSILSKDNKLDTHFLGILVGQVCALIDRGINAVLVSSGAVSSGMPVLKFKSRPNKIDDLQACASVGQGLLMQSYIEAFGDKGKHCAQLLLTWDDFDDRRRYLNAKNTILSLMRLKTVPVINENDTVSTEEIKFGDNDNLASLVAIMLKADLLVNLSDVDGLFDEVKALVPLVPKITPDIKKLACPTKKNICRGGMITKIEAAEKAVNSGIPCIIANGKIADILPRIVLHKETAGTTFLPSLSRFAGKKSWIAYGVKPKGGIFIDEGAEQALLKKFKSLLSVGVLKSEGKFEKGDIVSVLNRHNKEIARGRTACSWHELELIKGRRHSCEIIHRNDLVII
ncbi:MAG: glutamate 5-kinase [Candidatus Omnitrophica bacterium CG11_big_fil_rev_8_21_14_0_20_42_13]|uniref:Glutamate 5-kinase n=1 Tax=Candidatus Ghiorseimicrobium undicola TaxID=1974746 RepID=A0A2H0LZU7_9BACT|nr:MAG: glutamate 5-kinase [Candidatus Omnitrophica bacterium CG11_big_fil_rev_8_21_14_0_20_42_13]